MNYQNIIDLVQQLWTSVHIAVSNARRIVQILKIILIMLLSNVVFCQIKTYTAKIPAKTASTLAHKCYTKGENPMSGFWSLGDKGPVVHQYINLYNNTLQFIRENWTMNGDDKTIDQRIIIVNLEGKVVESTCSRISESYNNTVKSVIPYTCDDAMIQKTVNDMITYFSLVPN